MTTFPINPTTWASIRDVRGTAHLFTHANPEGRGFLTYTGLDWALAHGSALTLDGRGIKLRKAEVAAIRKASRATVGA